MAALRGRTSIDWPAVTMKTLEQLRILKRRFAKMSTVSRLVPLIMPNIKWILKSKSLFSVRMLQLNDFSSSASSIEPCTSSLTECLQSQMERCKNPTLANMPDFRLGRPMMTKTELTL